MKEMGGTQHGILSIDKGAGYKIHHTPERKRNAQMQRRRGKTPEDRPEVERGNRDGNISKWHNERGGKNTNTISDRGLRI